MTDTGFTGVADYLTQRRNQQTLSQEALAEHLLAHSECFSGIDGLAISRWERGAVSPSIERQVALMQFFGDEPYLLLGSAQYELKQLPSLGTFHKWMQQNLLYNHVMGGHPYIDDETANFDKCGSGHQRLDSWLGLVSQYNANLTRGRELWSKSQLQGLVKALSTQAVFYYHEGQLLGHLVLIRVNESTLQQLLEGTLLESELTPDHLVGESDEACLYVLSSYLGSRGICEDGLTHMFRSLIENSASLALGFKARTNFGVKLMDLMQSEVVDKGEVINSFRDGARHQGKYYEYVSYKVIRERLLANPTLLNLIRQQSER